MSRSAASMAAVCPTSVRPAPATASGLSTLDFGDPPAALADRVLDEPGDEATGQLMDRARRLEAGMERSSTSRIRPSTNGTAARSSAKREQAGAQAIIDVMRVIGDIIRNRSRLRLEARVEAELQALHLHRSGGPQPGRRAPGSAQSARPRRRAAARCA